MNQLARRVEALGRKLRAFGPAGKKALASLLDHADPGVVVWAANHVDASDRGHALEVLEAIRKVPGLIGMDAEASIFVLQDRAPPIPVSVDRTMLLQAMDEKLACQRIAELQKTGTIEVRSELLPFLDHSSPRVRREARKALAMLDRRAYRREVRHR